jgi:hypothetical protein
MGPDILMLQSAQNFEEPYPSLAQLSLIYRLIS